MPRCITCDSCSEIDGTPPQSYWWLEKESGYVCTPCRRSSYLAPKGTIIQLDSNSHHPLGEVPILDTDDDYLETFELLHQPGVGKYSEGDEGDT